MRRAPLLVAVLVAVLVAACSSNPGTATLGPPSPAAATTPAGAATTATTATSAPPGPAPRPTRTPSPTPSPRRAGTPSPTPSPTPTRRVPQVWVVTITGFAFDPDTPAVHVGDSLRVTNRDPDAHTLTARNGSFDTGQLAQGRSVTLRLTRAGVFDFVCSNHPSMTGQISVSP